MGVPTQAQKVAALKRSVASFDSQIQALLKENYPTDGPKISSLKLQRSSKVVELTKAEQELQSKAA